MSKSYGQCAITVCGADARHGRLEESLGGWRYLCATHDNYFARHVFRDLMGWSAQQIRDYNADVREAAKRDEL